MESVNIKFCAMLNNIRIDKYLAQTLKYSRSHISKIINEGNLLVNNKKVKSSYTVKKHDTIFITLKKPEKLNLTPQNLNIEIVYQDEFIAVVNKPANMVVHPSAGHNQNTLVNALLFHCKNLSSINDVIRPGIVHRLDKDTSGLMVIAKNNLAHLSLSEQFKNRNVKKYYKALTFGIVKPEKGRIESFIGRHKKNRLKFSSFTSSGKLAITNYSVEKYFKNFSLLDINIETGRTHQIRVHLSEKGFPLVGDSLYASKKILKTLPYKIERVFLHSYRLIFNHPETEEVLDFRIELPDELKNFLRRIEDEKNNISRKLNIKQ